MSWAIDDEGGGGEEGRADGGAWGKARGMSEPASDGDGAVVASCQRKRWSDGLDYYWEAYVPCMFLFMYWPMATIDYLPVTRALDAPYLFFMFCFFSRHTI